MAFNVVVEFGRQKNLARRAVRPDGKVTRDLRRRGAAKASLLDLKNATHRPSLLERVASSVARWFGK